MKVKTVYDGYERIVSLKDDVDDIKEYLGRVEELDDAVQEVIDEATEQGDGWLVPRETWLKLRDAHAEM